MHVQQVLPFSDCRVSTVGAPQASGSVLPPVGYGFNEPERRTHHFVRSVVEEAGLSRFVYLKGCSGRRYVFSMIKPEQARLYERAVFASGGVDGGAIELISAAGGDACLSAQKSAIYVHLLADEDSNGSDVIADLTSAIQ